MLPDVEMVTTWVLTQIVGGALRRAGGAVWQRANENLIPFLRSKLRFRDDTDAGHSRQEQLALVDGLIKTAAQEGQLEALRALCEDIYRAADQPALKIQRVEVGGDARIVDIVVDDPHHRGSVVDVSDTRIGGDLEIREIRRDHKE